MTKISFCPCCSQCTNLSGVVCKDYTILKTLYCVKHYYKYYDVLDNIGSGNTICVMHKDTDSSARDVFYQI